METCCHSDSSGKPSANTDVKYSQMSTIIIILLAHTYCFTYSYLTLVIFKQNYLTQRWDPNRYCHSLSKRTTMYWLRKGISHIPEFQNWSLTIRWCSIISKTLAPLFCVAGSYPSEVDKVSVFTVLRDWFLFPRDKHRCTHKYIELLSNFGKRPD